MFAVVVFNIGQSAVLRAADWRSITMATQHSTAVRLDPSLVGERIPLDEIPVIDFGPFLRGSLEERWAVAHKIGKACRNIGFFYLTGHGIPRGMVDGVFAEAKRFFALPLEKKKEIAIENSPCHRGYFSLGGENLDPKQQVEAGNFKEGIKIGRDLPLDHPLVKAGTPLHGPDQWPSDLPGWQETMQGYYDAMVNLGREVMHAFALALELPENHFDRWLTGPMATLGPLHYPPSAARSRSRGSVPAPTRISAALPCWPRIRSAVSKYATARASGSMRLMSPTVSFSISAT